MRKTRTGKRIVSILLSVLIVFTGIMPAAAAFAADGVEGYYDIELFYKDSGTIIPSTMMNDKGEEVTYIEYMTEGDELALSYELIDTQMPNNGYVKWYSETPTLVDVTQEGVVKAFDSSKGAVVHSWIDNEVKTIPLVGSVIATVLEKALFNDYVNVDTMDTDAIIAIVEAAFGSDSPISKWIESYKGELIDSLRYYLDNINSNIHVQLYDAEGKLLDDDYVQICVTRNDEWYANFLPNGTHITNKSQINTTVAVGSTVQLYAITTPVRLKYGCIYSVKSSSIFDQGKVVATVDDSGLVTFKNKGTVTIMVSPDTEQVIQNILSFINKFYEINGEMIDSDKVAEILIKYVGLDINRNVLAAILDACFAIADIAGGATDPVKLTATAAKLIGNLVLQFAYNDTITFNVVDAQPITDFSIEGATTVKEGSEIQLEITNVQPEVGDTSDITWRSSDPSIASVDEKTGIVTGRDAGGSLGSLSTNKCTIYAVSAANNIERSYTITVSGKTGRYLSDVEIVGEKYLEMGQETDYSYTVYPKRVAENDNLYITWGMVTGMDEDGNITYSWADSENPATDGRGSLDNKGHYTVIGGGNSQIAVKAQTGYYLSNGNFYEISSYTRTFDVVNGVPVENIQISVGSATGIASSLTKTEKVDIDGEECTYVSVKAGTQYYGVGAIINASVYPENASNQNLTWVMDNGNYNTETAGDTHRITVTKKAGHEEADTFNLYAVSADGSVRSNVITVCVSKNNVTKNTIDQKPIEITNGQQMNVTHSIDFSGSADGTYSACYKCNWYSTDKDVFTVEAKNNSNGDAAITAVDVGTATLYCVSADGGIIDTCQVTVYPDKSYLKEIVKLCDKTVIKRTSENASLYKKYMNRLDQAYTILYDIPMASQTSCDTYANELLYAFYKLGGFVGILGVDITGKNNTVLPSEHITVKVSNTGNYTNYSYDFDYVIAPKNAMYSSVKWTSSNSSVTVDKNGICKPASNNACSAVITCTVADYMNTETSSSVFISFVKTATTGVSLNTNAIDGGKIGETQTLKATVTPTPTLGVGGASSTAVYWTSSDENIATVDQDGVVTFVEGGNCIITATTYDGGYTAQCAVNVVTNYTALELLVQQYKDLQLNSINYYPDSWEVFMTAMDNAQKMLAYGRNSQAEVNRMYSELEEAYNSLQKYNYIQKIELYLDGEQTQEFYQYDLSLLSEGISYKNAVLDLNVRLYPNNGSYQSVKWQSSTTDISVSNDGMCSPTANKSCYGLITCTVTDHYGTEFTDSVWVSFSYYPVTELRLSETNISGNIDTTYQLNCTVYPTGTSLLHVGAASIQDYYWESDDESIAAVDQNGLVTFVSSGATTIRAVSYDGGISAECKVSTNGDRTALMQALENYKNVDYTDYEYSYGMAFTDAYAEAERALTDVSYTQAKIDNATNTLVTAYNNMVNHPYVKAQSVTVDYKTFKDPLLASKSQVSSGTIDSNDALSVDLSKSYADNNYRNYAVLTASAYPANAMYKSISWSVDNSYKAKTSIDNNEITITPDNGNNGGAWAIVTAKIVDNYDRVTTRTVYVVLSDKVCKSFAINEASKTIYATAAATPINYTISGSPEFADIIWTSNNEDIVKVDASGALIPVEKGTATVTGKTLDGGFTSKITVTVLTDFALLASKQTEYYDLIQSVKDSYTYTEDSLNALSEVVAQAQTMIDENKATQAEVNSMISKLDDMYEALVLYVAATDVAISAEEDSSVSVVGDGYIRYTGSLLNNKEVVLKPVFADETAVYTEISWESSNPNMEIDENGILTNKTASAGVTEVTCTVKNVFGGVYSNKAYVSFVRYAATGISFDDEMVFGAPAQTVTLKPNITNTNNSTLQSAVVKECVYTTNDPSIATVDDNGVVTFITQGSATITATTKDGGYSASIVAFTTWDTAALKAAIDEAEKITYTDYAYDYGTAFNEAFEAAKAVYANVYASQAEIDNACTRLAETMTALEGHAFIKPELSVVWGDEVLENDGIVQVDADTQQATVALKLNDGAMIKSSAIAVSEENNVTVRVNGSNAVITKNGEKGSLKLDALVVDDYGREYTLSYNLNVIDKIIPATSIVLTADGEVIGSTLTHSCGGRYTNFKSMQIGYIPTPGNANAITDVTYKSSAENYIEISKDGVISVTTMGALRSSNTAKITCTVTSADGTVAEASFVFTITRA
ncbi:MAG: Ig-like domain-containing protein [Clostridium sp.]|nr:Ig-like domain-containing protein [Clostridium sp.]